jgi:uncharacterized protein YjdB
MFLVLGVINAFGQVITITVPDTLVDAGATLTIPVSITELTAEDGVFSGEWRFNRSSNLITFTGYSTVGTLLDGEFTQFNATNGDFAFATDGPLTGAGTLLLLHVKVSDDAVKFQQSQISISSAMLNEGLPTVNTQPGTISVRGITISPKEPSGNFVVGQSFQFSLSGNIVPPVTWSSSADSVATVDSTGLIQGISPGSIKIFALDANGLSDSTSLFRVNPENILDLTVGVSNTSTTQTLEDSVQVTVSDVSGLNITSGQFDLTYDASRIEILSVSTEGTIREGRPNPTVFIDGSTIKVAFADATPLVGEGALMNLKFRVFKNATGTVSVTPQNVQFNENISAQTTSGIITILNAPDIIVDQPEPEFTIGETMNFAVVSGGNAPYRWESDNPSVAMIDENTGVATALSRGVANIIAIDADNFESDLMELRVNDVTASIPDFITFDYEIFELPLEITDLTGLGITSYELNVSYDETVLILDQIITAGTMSDGLSISSSAENGLIRIAVASSTPIAGAGNLFRLNFSFAPGVMPVTNTSVQITKVQFNEPGPQTPTATRRGGEITLDSEQFPDQVVLNSPVNGAADVSLTPVLNWFPANLADTYLVELATDELFLNTIFSESVADTFYTSPALSFETVYYWRVSGENTFGTGDTSAVFSFITLTETIITPPPPAVGLISLSPVENGLEIIWQIASESFQGTFNIYRGNSKNQLQYLANVDGASRSYIDTNPTQGSIFYAITAVNEVENEGELSNVLTFVQQTVQATTDWQLISIPVKTDSIETQLATLFKFNAGYSVTEKLEPVFGYWIKTKSSQTESYPVNGSGLDTLTITLNTGWNLIGSVSDSIHRSLINDPENILSSAPIYTFNSGVYQESLYIVPQNGHWIHANQPGTISLDIYSDSVIIESEVSGKSESATQSSLSSLMFSIDGFSTTISISDESLTNQEKNAFLLPPVAPDPVLDVRLANQTRILDSQSSLIRLITENYPVRVEMDDEFTESPYAYRIIMKSDDSERSIDLVPGKVQVIDKEYDVIEIIKIHSDEMISEHRLMPNYPNPFNPTTTLHYYLNENANVTLEVFDLLGRKVSVLYSGPQLSGEYRISFDARNLASGIYIVRFKAGSHVDIRRISLIK